MKVYVASSWKNQRQSEIVKVIRDLGIEVYDFRNPNGEDHGFAWSELSKHWEAWSMQEFRRKLQHPIAQKGFKLDYDAMKAADAGVLVLPSGASSHLEAGYFVGAGKPLVILLSAQSEPELMYATTPWLCASIGELRTTLELLKGGYTNGKNAQGGQETKTASQGSGQEGA